MSATVAGPAGFPRLLTGIRRGRSIDFDEHLERLGPLPDTQNTGAVQALLETVEQSGLRGRGGGGFSTGKKMRAVIAASPGRSFVVANGAEGEPASRKDGLLLSGSPHLILDGIALATAVVEADQAFLCVKQDSVDAVAAINFALEERERARADEVRPDLVEIPGGYIAGEESALINYLNGGASKPSFVPPRPFESGVAGQPTLVLNIETLASLALISRYGESWNRSVGTADDPGSILVTMAGAVSSPGVYEIAAGTPISKVLKAAGGPTKELQAFLIGGYGGTWRSTEFALRLSVGHTALAAVGTNLGPGVIVALPSTACGVIEMGRISRFLADQSAGQCGPCLHGLRAIADVLEKIAGCRANPGAHTRIEQWGAEVVGRGACHHPDGAVRFISSGLAVFADEIECHERQGRCSVELAANVLPLPAQRGLETEPV